MAEMKRGTGALKLLTLAAILLSGVLVARFTPVGDLLTLEGVGQGLELLGNSMWAPFAFIALYAVATALAIPGTILTLAGGALFGVFWGTIFNSIAANIGANLAFLLSRHLGREGVQQFLGERREAWPAVERLDRVIETHGFRGLLILRLIPVAPFNGLNFGAGLVALSWPKYALATVVGIFPGTVIYTFFADALLQGSQEASRDAFLRLLLAGSLLVLLSLLPVILRKLRVRIPEVAAIITVALAAASLPWAAPSQAQEIPDHSAFTVVLGEVARPPQVDYALLKRNAAGLLAYLDDMAATSPEALASASRNERLAFWINAYNACMLSRVSGNYPIQKNTSLLESVRNAVTGKPENSVWQISHVFTEAHCRIAGAERSQDEIEHEIIRPMGEPRIHFVVNCAAASCPPLSPVAFMGHSLDAQLDAAVRKFMATPLHFIFEDERTLRVNRVLDWFADDFDGVGGLKQFFSAYAEGEERERLLSEETRVRFFEYDWTLNDVAR